MQSIVRDKLAQMYIEALEQEKIPWRQKWSDIDAPYNASTGMPYHGVNNLMLNYIAAKRGYEDPRWMTFNQANKAGYKIKPAPEGMKGDYGVKIEYWAIYDKARKKNISFNEYQKIIKVDPEREEEMKLVNRVSTVFNAEQIEGIPEYKLDVNNLEFELDEAMENLIENMQIEIFHKGNKAVYFPEEDFIIIPEERQFKSEYDYKSTLLHELAHATGHPSRLDRDIQHKFGSKEYAKEELRAEIASSFLCQEFHLDPSEDNLDNHKAYIQSWIGILKNDSSELFKSIKDANKISDYMLEKSDLVNLKNKNLEQVL